MRWFTCFHASPVIEAEPVVKSKATATDSKEAVDKQDSAYGLDREKIKSSAYNKDAALQEDMLSYGQLVSSDYSRTESHVGKAASLKTYGPPKPSCNDARLQNLMELGLLNKASGDPEIQHIMQLMCTIFDTNSALVALLGEDRVYIHDAINFKKGDFGWRMSLCAHTLTPANHQVMIVEDAQKDARFAHLPLITHGKVRFYAGTPIVSSRGHRLGTVCFVGDKPRKFDAEGSQMLINMGELVTRELERDWMADRHSKQATSKSQVDSSTSVMRATECFNEAVMFVDTSQPKWQILHLNSAASTRLKLYDVTVDISEGSKLWDLFQIVDVHHEHHKHAPWEVHTQALQAGQNFEQHNVRLNTRFSSNGQSHPIFKLSFRCAATTTIDSNSACVGAPAFLPTTESNHNFYFVSISPDRNSRTSNQSLMNALQGTHAGEVPFEGVELGPLLGKGGYGSVYRGIKTSSTSQEPTREIVAIKVIENMSNLRMEEGVPLETSITRNAHHPNVVHTLDFALVHPGDDDGSMDGDSLHDSAHSKSRSETQVWMMLEYCDCGSLQEASEKGFFRIDGVLQLPMVLAVAKDVAAGMAFLHSRSVAHGDLTGGNVLLATDDSSAVGVTAKVADFGLARNLDVASKIETRTYGTVTHMPPELLEKGIFSQAADVFAFGVLLWELWHGVRAWSSLTFAQIITAVVANKKTLTFGSDVDPQYAELSLKCMHKDPAQRPSFSEALSSLESLCAAHKLN